eukprot:CAMPEP_0185779138 /NCGR_PEP_ID=MMETSP1174-20130828/94805_1 /TAXON_ID=35687 /ORGANISM="Dictyocha speculum, Strain CCMP1381" /LENGTH=70 /DNA_ID=CAMNT_0028468141 /DNA_START=125 /DNA_END=333 /DNA_ORIENTATION=+
MPLKRCGPGKIPDGKQQEPVVNDHPPALCLCQSSAQSSSAQSTTASHSVLTEGRLHHFKDSLVVHSRFIS